MHLRIRSDCRRAPLVGLQAFVLSRWHRLPDALPLRSLLHAPPTQFSLVQVLMSRTLHMCTHKLHSKFGARSTVHQITALMSHILEAASVCTHTLKAAGSLCPVDLRIKMLDLDHDEENEETYYEPENILEDDEMWRTSDDDMPSDNEVLMATRALAEILPVSCLLVIDPCINPECCSA